MLFWINREFHPHLNKFLMTFAFALVISVRGLVGTLATPIWNTLLFLILFCAVEHSIRGCFALITSAVLLCGLIFHNNEWIIWILHFITVQEKICFIKVSSTYRRFIRKKPASRIALVSRLFLLASMFCVRI